jgi:hypothetical protein
MVNALRGTALNETIQSLQQAKRLAEQLNQPTLIAAVSAALEEALRQAAANSNEAL